MDRIIPYRGNGRLFSADNTPRDEHKEVVADASKPTKLFRHLEQRDWGEASICLQKRPQEATVWVRKVSKSREISWTILPLHASIAFGAPFSLIEELVNVHPDSLRKLDHEGKLPLHYAAICSHADQKKVMCYMLKQYPESMWIKDFHVGRSAIEIVRNDELQKAERIRMRKKLSGRNEDEYNEVRLDTVAKIEIDEKENATISNRRVVNRNLINKMLSFPIKTRKSDTSQALDDMSNIDDIEEEKSCRLICSANVEETNQLGRHTIYLNFALSNDSNENVVDESKSVASHQRRHIK